MIRITTTKTTTTKHSLISCSGSRSASFVVPLLLLLVFLRNSYIIEKSFKISYYVNSFHVTVPYLLLVKQGNSRILNQQFSYFNDQKQQNKQTKRTRIQSSIASKRVLVSTLLLLSSTANNNNNYNNNENYAVVAAAAAAAADTDSTSSDSTSNSNNLSTSIRFLGTGINAIVRPGVVLLAPKDEYHHFYRNSAIFIFAIGTVSVSESNDDNDEYIIRGVIVDHPTPFTVAEMILDNDDNTNTAKPDTDNIMSTIATNPLGQNLVFRGGETGTAGMILLHNQSPTKTATLSTNNGDVNNNNNNNSENGIEIGTSGIYHGGWMNAIQSCSNNNATTTTTDNDNNKVVGTNSSDNYKAFFNYCEFTEAELDSLLSQSRSSSTSSSSSNNNNNTTSFFDEYQWCSIEIINNPSIVLNNDYDRGDCWSLLRNIVRQNQQQV